MATSYTTLLGFALPANGELDGTWGDTVNNAITQLAEDSIAGVASGSVTGGNWTLSTTGSGASNEARCAILRVTGAPGTARDVIAPAKSKAYIVENQSDSTVTIKASGTTGVAVVSGAAALVAWDGSDFVRVGASAGGSNTQVQYNSSGVLAGSANLTFNGTTLTAAGLSGPMNGTLGATTPSTVAATTITASSTVTAAGFSGPINGTVGAVTPSTVAATTITASGIVTAAGFSGPINGTVGAVTPSTVAATTVTASGTVTAAGFSGPINGSVGAVTPSTVAATTATASTSVTSSTLAASTALKATTAAPLELYEATDTYKVAMKASSSLAASYTLTMPVNDGDSGQVLATDGTGVLTWATPSSGITTAGNNTWTGTQTFTNSLMRLLGSSTGYTTFTSANSSATNYTITFPAETMTVGFRNIPSSGSKTTTYTLATSDVGKFVTIGSTGGALIIPNSTFAAGDVVTIYNNTSSTMAVSVSVSTAYLAGVNTDVGTFDLATRGLATVLFISSTSCVISGNVS